MRYLALAILFIAVQANATVMLISDIDDTVRQTNSRNLGSMTVLKNLEFSGLSKLYSHLKNTVSEIDYVTGNPRPLKSMVQYFLNSNNFPQGLIFTRDTKFDTVTHKVNAIEGLIRSGNPDQMILVGDNGEQDPVSYNMIEEKHPGLTLIFMHQLYDEEVRQGQVPWLTSIDLASLMFAKGFIDEKALDDVLNSTLPKLFSTPQEREKVFPSWAQCKIFFQNYERVDARFSAEQKDKLDQYEQFLLDRCS